MGKVEQFDKCGNKIWGIYSVQSSEIHCHFYLAITCNLEINLDIEFK